MNLIQPFIFDDEVDNKNNSDMAGSVGVDFGFFTKDAAKKIDSGVVDDGTSTKKRSSKPKVAVNGEILPERDIPGAAPTGGVLDVDYARSYNETNNLIRGAIMQADELSSEVKQDIDAVRASKTLKNKYTYITNLTASASSLLTTKISAIKELNSTITQAHNLELNRMKALKLDKADENDDMRMMDLYSSFVNTPVGVYNPNSAPTIQDITLGVNGVNPAVGAVEMNAGTINNGQPLTPEQNRMRMESNPNIQVVVRYDQATGQRCFDVVDKSTGMSVPNYPRPDGFLLEDTTIDVHTGIARNRNINAVWPLLIEGSTMPINEY